MSEVKFSKEHEWIKLEGDIATIGITKHATEMLGDIVFVELPEKGSNVEKDGTAGVVESTKAASDVYTPVTGEILETNQQVNGVRLDNGEEINCNYIVFNGDPLAIFTGLLGKNLNNLEDSWTSVNASKITKKKPNITNYSILINIFLSKKL